MPSPKKFSATLPAGTEMKRIVSMAVAAELSGVSQDTLRRRYRDKIIKLSPRRSGMRLGDALMLTDPAAA